MTDYVIALGTFDGVHIGHRALISRALNEGKKRGIPVLIYTFSGHPLAAFGCAPKLLMDADERMAALKETGAEVVADAFTRQYAATPPEEFVRMLKSRFSMAAAVGGFNYTFGAGGKGDMELLKSLSKSLRYDVLEIPATYYEGDVVSSTRIRSCLERGEIRLVNAMLGDYYALSGCVVENRHIGSTIGFPTANIESNKVLPQSGVYAAYAETDEKTFCAVTNIGRNPTVEGKKTTIETHLLDYTGCLYGKRLTVRFCERLRGEVRFKSVSELAEQIACDTAAARKILGQNMQGMPVYNGSSI